jgi:hypothetical protein
MLHRGNVQANARKALGNAYPVCAALVGDTFFDGLAFDYAVRTPSRSGDLNEYGGAFAAFLAGFAPVAAQVPYLPDVAALEWSVHRAHYAADAVAFDASRLADLAAELYPGLRFALNPACALHASRWPIADIWNAHGIGADAVAAVDAAGGPQFALVLRPAYRVDVAPLTAAEHAFLEAASGGAPLADALARAHAVQPDFALDVPLARWVAAAVVVDLAPPT